jgi:hypothetical protein
MAQRGAQGPGNGIRGLSAMTPDSVETVRVQLSLGRSQAISARTGSMRLSVCGV